MSKGSSRRPAQVSAQTYRDNHDRIFAKTDAQNWAAREIDAMIDFYERAAKDPSLWAKAWVKRNYPTDG